MSAKNKIDYIWKYFLKYRENTHQVFDDAPLASGVYTILRNFLSLIRDLINTQASLGNVIHQLIRWMQTQIGDNDKLKKLVKEWDNFFTVYQKTYKKVQHMKYLFARNFQDFRTSDDEDIQHLIQLLKDESIVVQFGDENGTPTPPHPPAVPGKGVLLRR